MHSQKSTPDSTPCAAPYCGQAHAPWADVVLLDRPDHPQLVFCDVQCLAAWARHHAETGFKETRDA